MKDPPQVNIKLKNRLWPILALLLIGLQVAFPYKGWLLLLLGLGGAWLASYFWARGLAKGLRLAREVRYGWAQVGDQLEERFILTNDAWAPAIWVELTDFSTLPDRQKLLATGVGSHEQNSWLSRQTCSRRGLFTLGPTRLETGDIFGIYRVTIDHLSSTTLLVTPPILPLPSIRITGGNRAGEGHPTRKNLEPSIRVSGVRDYVHGDSLHLIHWQTTARRNSLSSKTFENTPVSDWWIVLDLCQEDQVGEGQTSTEECGVILAASLADRGLNSGVAVGLISNSKELTWLPPKLGERQKLDMMQTLAKVSPGFQTLAELLHNTLSVIHHQASLIIITPSPRKDWLDPLFHFVSRGMIPTILLMDPRSFGGSISVGSLANTLESASAACYTITPEFFEGKAVEKRPANAWEWRILGTGRAYPVHQPDDLSWRSL